MRDGIDTVLPGQFDRTLPQRLRQLRPPRLGAAKLIQLALQLGDWLRNGCAFAVHNQPPPDAMRRVPLFPRRLLVRFQDLLDPRDHRHHLWLLPFRFLPRSWHRTVDRLAYHPPMNPELPRHPLDRPDAVFVLAPNLLE